ncbi:thioredoxin [Dysgonomonas sp. 521]|uniref:thioredoxin family protein n=1 Tax=Dysgonomonas sp. 521 TaxID=2302932 RepID=UPI0013D1DAA7|nr:thioredoxin fold domain-containing protein [Dysgonomonas sp. 521]NDV93341.1 thioredoxin [Dysgonomonas sp. 521]
MFKLKEFRFKTWHFCLLLGLFLFVINIVGPMTIQGTSYNMDEDIHFEELNDLSVLDKDSSNIVSVIFYNENSDICNKMMDNISRISNQDIKFYRSEINKNPELYTKYNVSGVPSILVFKGNKEIDRIMGVVPTTNLEIIYNRIMK